MGLCGLWFGYLTQTKYKNTFKQLQAFLFVQCVFKSFYLLRSDIDYIDVCFGGWLWLR